MAASLESLPRELMGELARHVTFDDTIALLSVSRAVRGKVLSCAAFWSSVSFALLPMAWSSSTLGSSMSSTWTLDAALPVLVDLLKRHDMAQHVTSLTLGYKEARNLAPIAELPNLREFTAWQIKAADLTPLFGLSLRAFAGAIRCPVSVLEKFPLLESLDLRVPSFTPPPPLCFLRDLSLYESNVDMQAIVESYASTLVSLALPKCSIDNLEEVTKLTELRQLNLSCVRAVDDELLSGVSRKLACLEQLNVNACFSVTSDGLGQLRALPNLVIVSHLSIRW